MKFSLVIGIVFFGATASASEVRIYVSDSKDPKCLHQSDSKEVHYLLKSEEVIGAVQRYFRTEANPEQYDTALANAGLKFCGQQEEKRVFSAIVKTLDQKQP